ncbi:MAG: LemA family protein, partial [Elusimicrobia bacterium]|nr:LemA family protein [Elusimicrobiota bacterium]
ARAGAITMDKSLLEDPAAFKKFEASQGALGSALSRLLVVSERYPQLTATQGYRDLQVQLEGTENRIAVARRDFNDAAQGYNTAIKMFPGSVVAGFGGFRERPYFAADQAAQAAPAVKF